MVFMKSTQTVADSDEQESSADQRTSQHTSPPLRSLQMLYDPRADRSDLRERLLAQGLHGSNNQTVQRLDHQQPHHPVHPHDHNIDPAIAGSGMMNVSTGEGGADGNQSDGKKGKRELSTSKRAAQNRAAQVSTNWPLLVMMLCGVESV